MKSEWLFESTPLSFSLRGDSCLWREMQGKSESLDIAIVD